MGNGAIATIDRIQVEATTRGGGPEKWARARGYLSRAESGRRVTSDIAAEHGWRMCRSYRASRQRE